MKKLPAVMMVVVSLCSVSAFAANAFEQSATQAAQNTIQYQQQASRAKQQAMDACCQSRESLHNAMKDLKGEDRKAFMKEYRYQMRQQVAKLGRDEVYDEFVCGAIKPAYPPKKQIKEKNKAKQSIQDRKLSGSVLVPINE